MNTIWATNIPQAYTEAIIKLRTWGEEEESRNGPVITSQDPVLLSITNPRERVLFDKTRNCNPFFHVMETVWMFSGSNDVRWIEQFNKGFREFADRNTNILHGAYGHRWIKHFGCNQIQAVGDLLKSEPTTRRAVISMWDPRNDLSNHSDLPCNTSIMFRKVQGDLDMTVVNRSNDLIWGMLGANAVHMTYLHELISHISGIPMGLYKVFTNNLHIYKNMPNFEPIWETRVPDDPYLNATMETYPLLVGHETYTQLVGDCARLIANEDADWETFWGANVVAPMYDAYMARLEGRDGRDEVSDIAATDWRLACENYINLREERK